MKRNAFTLVEILITVTLISIIATITIMSLGSVVEDKQGYAENMVIRNVTGAVQSYRKSIDDMTATPSLAELEANGFVSREFAPNHSIVYSGGEVSNVVDK
ncbi:MAG: prepilin-type N-terminal cleavage/methylation domain-containing protein [Phycisphaerales bacterium]|jgi:prepilin-type N-terminal cleavage/methylation domain-containing protein|nr:prepilin-type N-terminal cleavage/methylation domain-containing protein [Phycisphaerales bacterium]MBT7170986.1 prepilin-type N-terminal cleavage/methylation domain-containing protein [Phycisphaerales bacterium]